MQIMIMCFLSLALWFFIILWCVISFLKTKNTNTKNKDFDKEAILLVENDKKIKSIINLIKDLESDPDNEKNRVKSKILKTKLKLMISNPVLRESIMRIKKINKN